MNYWLYLRVILIFGALLIDIVDLVYSIIKRKITKFQVIFGIIAAVVLAVSASMDVNVSNPSISISKDRTAVEISADKGTSIEYSLSAGDKRGEWIEYTGPITGITENTVVSAKASFLITSGSEVEEMEVKVDPNTGYLYRMVETEKASVASISAEYNERTCDGKTAGNTYIGYKLSPSDFTVTGIDTKGNTVYISQDDCEYSADVLKKGNNTITVSYEGVNGRIKTAQVVIPATDPELLEITASLKKGEQTIVNTDLSPDQFTVRGTYEDGKRKLSTDEYTISPTNIVDGSNIITITAGTKTTTVEIKGSTGEVTAKEKEDNNQYTSANLIGLNEKCVGKLSDEEDVDYFKINITDDKGTVILHFGHEKFNDEYAYWNAIIFSDEDNPIITIQSTGVKEETVSNKIRLVKGIYYIRVEHEQFSDEKYWIKPVYEKADEFSETEPNDDFQYAYPITEFGTDYTGNLQQEDDKDFYKITTESKGKITITFQHEQFNSDWGYWDVNLSGSDGKTLLQLSSKGNAAETSSDAVRLPAGTYYITVVPAGYKSLDYKIRINFDAEGEEYETEPNDDFGYANSLSVGSSVTGNMERYNDVDFYKIDLGNGNGNLTITFKHEIFYDTGGYWYLSLLSSENGEAIPDTKNQNYMYIKGDQDSVAASWSGLKQGEYYLKVTPSGYKNDDYTISVSQ